LTLTVTHQAGHLLSCKHPLLLLLLLLLLDALSSKHPRSSSPLVWPQQRQQLCGLLL
jgi:hypothetical protein